MANKPIENWLNERVDRSLARSTRIHQLNSDFSAHTFVKREDELSSGISGSKLRKYSSLIPYLKVNGVDEVAIIGGPNSNNLVGLLQILKETKIRPWVFIRAAGDRTLQGNALLLKMLAPLESIRIIEKSDWENAGKIATDFLLAREQLGKRCFLVPEGALCFESLAGSLTLAEDILENEKKIQPFRHIYIDCGTGLSAIGLIIGLALLDVNFKERRIHVTTIANDSATFEISLRTFASRMSSELNLRNGINLPSFDFIEPPVSKKYGSVGKTVFDACREIAQIEGILMDPIYSVKHFLAMKTHQQLNGITDHSLFIFNGSALGLCGFQSQLAQLD